MIKRKRDLQVGKFTANNLAEKEKWSPQTPALDLTEFPQILATSPVTVLHFGAIWNRHDVQMDAVLQELRPQFAGKIAFYSVDVDKEQNCELCRQSHFLNIPALVCFLHGSWHETMIGAYPASTVVAKLEAWLSESNKSTSFLRE